MLTYISVFVYKYTNVFVSYRYLYTYILNIPLPFVILGLVIIEIIFYTKHTILLYGGVKIDVKRKSYKQR